MYLRVMIRLKKGQGPHEKSKEAITKAWIEEFGPDGKIFLDVLGIKTGQLKPESSELKKIYNQFLNSVQYAARLAEKI